jgi:hypothetical protein
MGACPVIEAVAAAAQPPLGKDGLNVAPAKGAFYETQQQRRSERTITFVIGGRRLIRKAVALEGNVAGDGLGDRKL